MMPSRLRSVAGVVLLTALACVDAQSIGSSRAPFQQLLHKTIDGATPVGSNLVFSPYSVETALYLLREAADGDSRRELAQLLGRGPPQLPQADVQQPGITLSLFTAFYHDSALPVKEKYRQVVTRQYDAMVEPQPFRAAPAAAVASINDRVRRETHGKVRQLLSPGDRQLVAVLVSAIYFRAEWRTALDARRTRPEPFQAADGRVQTVQMMSADGHYDYLSSPTNRFAAVAMPYKDERFQMILVLPDRDVNIADVVNQIDVSVIHKQMRQQHVKIKFPKFRIESKLPLIDVLKSLGVRHVFSRRADLGRMSPDPRLYVSDVQHSAVIETDERGSEAAAATSISISARSFTPSAAAFVADRPFLFFVYDVSTANVLFSGHVADAAAAQGRSAVAEDDVQRFSGRDQSRLKGSGRRLPATEDSVPSFPEQGQFRGGKPFLVSRQDRPSLQQASRAVHPARPTANEARPSVQQARPTARWARPSVQQPRPTARWARPSVQQTRPTARWARRRGWRGDAARRTDGQRRGRTRSRPWQAEAEPSAGRRRPSSSGRQSVSQNRSAARDGWTPFRSARRRQSSQVDPWASWNFRLWPTH